MKVIWAKGNDGHAVIWLECGHLEYGIQFDDACSMDDILEEGKCSQCGYADPDFDVGGLRKRIEVIKEERPNWKLSIICNCGKVAADNGDLDNSIQVYDVCEDCRREGVDKPGPKWLHDMGYWEGHI